MKNTFTVVADGKEYVFHNQIKNAFAFWTARYSFAAYIAVIGGEHRLDKRAEVISYNDNVEKGALFATYRIRLTSGEFAYPITSVGFAPFAGAALSNECLVSIRAKEVVIYGTIYLETDKEDFGFYAGENPLVQSLLGMRAFDTLTVRGHAGGASASEYTPVSATVYMADGLNVSFSASGGLTDFLLMWGELPCAQFSLTKFAPDMSGGFVRLKITD